MSTLFEYLQKNAIQCKPEEGDADVIFFGVKRGPDATAEGLTAAIKGHKGEFVECDPFDGEEHTYIELGAWAGDQGAALVMIGLGAALGMWQLLTPKTMLGHIVPPESALALAQAGLVSLQVVKEKQS